MGIEENFKDLEKPKEEKKLKVVYSKQNVFDEVLNYFEKTKSKSDITSDWKTDKAYFKGCMEFLRSYDIKPDLIEKINTR